jgi:hypothetical protein
MLAIQLTALCFLAGLAGSHLAGIDSAEFFSGEGLLTKAMSDWGSCNNTVSLLEILSINYTGHVYGI